MSYAEDASPVSTVRTSGHALPGRYIVVLKDRTLSARSVRDESARLVKAHGGAVRQTYGTVLKGYAAAMSADQARRVAADPGVACVEEDAEVQASAVQSNPPSWGLDRVDQESLPLDKSYSYATTASGVTAYVVDTGIRTSHSQFQGRAAVGADEVGDGQNGQDCAGHGTHVAGTVGGKDCGVAKGVKLVSVRALNCSGKGSSSSIIAAADWITAHADKPAVVNMPAVPAPVQDQSGRRLQREAGELLYRVVMLMGRRPPRSCGEPRSATSTSGSPTATTPPETRVASSPATFCFPP